MEFYCQKCGRVLKPGELRYSLRIELKSLFDGYIEDLGANIDDELDRLVEILKKRDPAETEKDVAQTISLTICRQCRNRLVTDWDIIEVKTRH